MIKWLYNGQSFSHKSEGSKNLLALRWTERSFLKGLGRTVLGNFSNGVLVVKCIKNIYNYIHCNNYIKLGKNSETPRSGTVLHSDKQSQPELYRVYLNLYECCHFNIISERNHYCLLYMRPWLLLLRQQDCYSVNSKFSKISCPSPF